jgi:anti-anti-sigma factor
MSRWMDGSGWYQIKIERGVVRVVLHGEFDVVESDELEQALLPLVGQPAACVELDLADVEFFGSRALGAVLAAQDRSAEHDSTLRVVAASPLCLRLFDIAGVSERLGIAQPGSDA